MWTLVLQLLFLFTILRPSITSCECLFQVRALRHVNVMSLVGACVEPNRTCVIMGYCGKGSLRDILQSRHVTLDKIFTSSFAHDIVQVNDLNHYCS